MSTPPPRTVDRLIGVYHSDAGWYEEATQAVRRFLGTTSCSLADLTSHRHHPDRWQEVVDGLAVPFDLVHLNERTPAVQEVSHGRTPCVLAQVGDELAILLRNQDLDRIEGNHEWFVRELHRAARDNGLIIPTTAPGTLDHRRDGGDPAG